MNSRRFIRGPEVEDKAYQSGSVLCVTAKIGTANVRFGSKPRTRAAANSADVRVSART